MKKFFVETLKKQKEQNLYRQLVESDVMESVKIKRGKKLLLNFSSNDYFGLSQNSQVKKAAVTAIKEYGVGAGASRYVSGNNSLYTQLEKQISVIKKCDDAIVFSSGYATAIGVIPALIGEGDLIVADRLIHASLIDAAKLSGARLMRFQHNDIKHAREILVQNRHNFKKCIIITETVFSMDGDVAPVSGLKNLAEEFNALLVVDDAHGLFQKLSVELVETKGTGFVLILGTLSKAVGTVGGYVAGDLVSIDFLRNFARSQIYSTALPPAVLAAASKSLQIIAQKDLAQKTMKNAKYFCQLMNLPEPQSAIVPVIIGDAKKTLDVARKLEEKGFLVGAIRYPTVEKNKARLRITFSSQHKKSDIKKLADLLKIVCENEVGKNN